MGSLHVNPVENEHVRTLRTKSERGSLSRLVDTATKDINNKAFEEEAVKTKITKQLESPESQLLAYVQEMVDSAVMRGDGKPSPQASQRLHRLLLLLYVDAAAKERIAGEICQ